MDILDKVIGYLLSEYQGSPPPFSGVKGFDLYRSLVNIRQPKPTSPEFLALEKKMLQKLIAEKGIVDIEELTPIKNTIYLWQGDCTRLKVDAIVNAANSALLGCFYPCHACIDNVIQTYAGVELRLACHEIMQKQGHYEATGQAKITFAYNLPSKFVLHTVGPIITHKLEEKDRQLLASCYLSCLKLAEEYKLTSLSFCCISTGEFRFPKDEAAQIAIKTVQDYLNKQQSSLKVVFNVFSQDDKELYSRLLT